MIALKVNVSVPRSLSLWKRPRNCGTRGSACGCARGCTRNSTRSSIRDSARNCARGCGSPNGGGGGGGGGGGPLLAKSHGLNAFSFLLLGQALPARAREQAHIGLAAGSALAPRARGRGPVSGA